MISTEIWTALLHGASGGGAWPCMVQCGGGGGGAWPCMVVVVVVVVVHGHAWW